MRGIGRSADDRRKSLCLSRGAACDRHDGGRSRSCSLVFETFERIELGTNWSTLTLTGLTGGYDESIIIGIDQGLVRRSTESRHRRDTQDVRGLPQSFPAQRKADDETVNDRIRDI